MPSHYLSNLCGIFFGLATHRSADRQQTSVSLTSNNIAKTFRLAIFAHRPEKVKVRECDFAFSSDGTKWAAFFLVFRLLWPKNKSFLSPFRRSAKSKQRISSPSALPNINLSRIASIIASLHLPTPRLRQRFPSLFHRPERIQRDLLVVPPVERVGQVFLRIGVDLHVVDGPAVGYVRRPLIE